MLLCDYLSAHYKELEGMPDVTDESFMTDIDIMCKEHEEVMAEKDDKIRQLEELVKQLSDRVKELED